MVPPEGRTSVADDDAPDFGALFPLPLTGDAARRLTSRTAHALHAALCDLADGVRHDVERFGDRPVVVGESRGLKALDRLPQACWRQDAAWRRRFAQAAADLAADLAGGHLPVPRCTAEEWCLHLAVEDADDLTGDGMLAEAARRLPVDDDDYDWDACDEFLFADHDVLLLNDPALDGVEDPAAEVAGKLGRTDLLPGEWFTPSGHRPPTPAGGPRCLR